MAIVCGIDFSESSRNASNAAAALAKQRNETLTLAHGVAPVALGLFSDEVTFGVILDQARKAMDAEVSRLASYGAKVEGEVVIGPAVGAVLDLAGENKAELIVIGAGESSSHLLLGSTAERLAAKSPIPVLVVRDSEALENWVKGSARLEVIIATDLSAADQTVVEWVKRMAPSGWHQTLLHIVWPPGEYQRLGVRGPIDPSALHPVVAEVVGREMKELAGMFDPPAKTLIEPNLGRPADAIVALARDQDAQLLVLGSHQRKGVDRLWLGSVAKEVLHLAPMNVAIVPSRTLAPGVPSIHIRCVLAATDFSGDGNGAVAYAFATAPPGSRIVLLNVIHRSQLQNRLEIEERLLALKTPPPGDVSISAEVVASSNVAEAICTAAERNDADIICAGYRGHGATSRLFIGSVAEELLLRSRRSVLLSRAKG